MKSILTTFAAFFLFTGIFAQDMATLASAEQFPVDATQPLVQERFQPAFPPSAGTFKDFLEAELQYPEIAQEYALEGTVVVEVEVSATGAVEVIGVVRSVSEPLDQAALAAINKLPRFLPAVTNGQAVAKRMMVPFRFSLR